MTRILTDGAHRGNMSLPGNYGTSTAIASVNVRSGTYCYKLQSGSNLPGFVEYLLDTPEAEFYHRWAIALDSEALDSKEILICNDGGSNHVSVRLENNVINQRRLSVYVGVTKVAESALLPWNWALEYHVIEARTKINATGALEVKFDGSTVITYAGNTGAWSISRIKFICPGGTNADQMACYVDDIAVNNISGGADNSWVGDGKVLAAMVPTGAGTYSDLTPNTGAGYAAVDEIPHDSDTTYISSTTLNHKSSFAMSNPTIPSGHTISRVWVEVVARELVANGDEIATFLKSSASENTGSDQILTTAHKGYRSADYLVDPNTSTTWNQGGLDAIEAGAVVR